MKESKKERAKRQSINDIQRNKEQKESIKEEEEKRKDHVEFIKKIKKDTYTEGLERAREERYLHYAKNICYFYYIKIDTGTNYFYKIGITDKKDVMNERYGGQLFTDYTYTLLIQKDFDSRIEAEKYERGIINKYKHVLKDKNSVRLFKNTGNTEIFTLNVISDYEKDLLLGRAEEYPTYSKSSTDPIIEKKQIEKAQKIKAETAKRRQAEIDKTGLNEEYKSEDEKEKIRQIAYWKEVRRNKGTKTIEEIQAEEEEKIRQIAYWKEKNERKGKPKDTKRIEEIEAEIRADISKARREETKDERKQKRKDTEIEEKRKRRVAEIEGERQSETERKKQAEAEKKVKTAIAERRKAKVEESEKKRKADIKARKEAEAKRNAEMVEKGFFIYYLGLVKKAIWR